MAKSGLVTDIDLSGPFFTKDVNKVLRENTREVLTTIAKEGERAARQLAPVRTGDFQRGIRGRVASLSGKRWAYTAVISQTHVEPWPGGGAKEYRGGKVERQRHIFRTVAGRLRGQVRANLTKGIE